MRKRTIALIKLYTNFVLELIKVVVFYLLRRQL